MATAEPPAKSKRRFFVMTPQLVWALSRDPYDFMLWSVIKMAAWDTGECILSTRDLATLSMMSVGKVQDCRAYLLRMGLLEGEFRRDPDYPQPVYHLRVPDLWQRNQQLIECDLGHSLKKRVAFKAAQRELPALPPPAERGAAPGEQGIPPDEQGIPPGERGMPPGERGIPPGETNKISQDTLESLEGYSAPNPPDASPPIPPAGGTLPFSPPIGGPGGSTVSPPNPPRQRRAERGGIASSPIGGDGMRVSQCHSDPRSGEESPRSCSERPGQGQISQGCEISLPATRVFNSRPQEFLPSLRSGRNDTTLPIGPPPDLHPLLLRLCRYEPEVVSSYRRKQLREAVQRLQAHRVGPGDLAAFERWWYGHDWRGKRGEPPEPGAILDTWGRFKYQPQPQEAGYGGYRFARPEEFGLA